MPVTTGLAGHNASVTLTYAGTTPEEPFLVTRRTKWQLRVSAKRIDITPFKSSFKAYWPEHYTSELKLWGYIDQAANPGFISVPEYAYRATVTIRPNIAETGKNIIISEAWVEEFQWLTALDTTNSFYASIVGMSAAALSWT